MRTPEAVAAMPCPVCRTPLATSERAGIEIDYCPTCRGVWLDRGELDKIIERSQTEPTAPPMPPAPPPAHAAPSPWDRGGQPGYRDPYPPRKRKKSFFEELFD